MSGLFALALAQGVSAQEPPANPQSAQPQVKVNMLNVCTPSAEEQKEIAAALARIPKEPLFGADFEVSRGRSTLTDMPNFLQPGQSRPCCRGTIGGELRAHPPRVFGAGAVLQRAVLLQQ